MFDTILTALTLVIVALMIVVGVRQYLNGEKLSRIIMDFCSVYTMANGTLTWGTLANTAFIVVTMAAFNWYFDVPVYTMTWLILWVGCWVAQTVVHYTCKVQYSNNYMYGVTAIKAFTK